MIEMRISVAIATHNGAEWISEQLASITAQSTSVDEIIVRDDSSTDGTPHIAAEHAQTTVIVGDRLGYAQNFGRALQATTGDVVFLADQDDVWLPHKVETMLEALGSNLLGVHDLTVVDAELTPHPPTMMRRLEMAGQPGTHIKGCATVVRRELLDVALPIPADMPHDTWLHQIAAGVGRKVVVDEPLALYRVHGSNTSTLAVNSLHPPTALDRFRLVSRGHAYRLLKKPASRARERRRRAAVDEVVRRLTRTR